MATINEGIEGMNAIQGLMISEVNSISGILYFLLQILIIGVLTSFNAFKKYRVNSFILFGINILVELIIPDFLIIAVGVKIIRIGFLFIHLVNFTQSFLARDHSFEQIKNYMDGRLDTKRIRRIFK